MRTRLYRLLLTAAALGLPGATAFAQDLDLQVRHKTVVTGADGVRRTTEFDERFIRRADTVWTERVVPAAAAALAHPHAASGHKHFDSATAARWVQRGTDAIPQLVLVDRHDRVTVDVSPADYENVGFQGRWDRAYFLIDPATLGAMSKAGAPLADGAQWFEQKTAQGSVRVLWDERLKYPREVRSASANGITVREMRATRIPATETAPWTETKSWLRKGLNDFLD